MKIRQLIGILLSTLLLFACIAGCGSSAPVALDTPAPVAADTPAPVAADTPTPAPEKTPTPVPVETPATPEPVKTVKIGLVATITGSNAESGRQCRLGTESAVKYVNDNGGIKALDGAKIELITVDATSDPAQAPIAVERALTDNPDIVAIDGCSTSSITLPMLPVIQQYKIPAICATAANSTITEQGCDYIFQPCHRGDQSSAMQVEFMGYLAGKLGKDPSELRLAVVFENSAWGQDVASNNKKMCENNGLTVVAEETYPSSGLTDASSIVSKLKNANVDAILPAMYVPDTKLLLNTMASMNYKPLIVGSGSALVWPSLVKDLGQDADGITSTSGWCWDTTFVSANKEFVKILDDFEAREGEFMAEQTGASFISLMMIVQAIENGKSIEPDTIRDEISKLTAKNCPWFALINPNSEFNENGKNIGASPVMAQWQGGKLRAVYPEAVASSPLLNPLTLESF